MKRNNIGKSKKQDELRTKELSKYGVRILRFSDLDILKNIKGVYEVIRKLLPPHLDPLPKGERKS